MKMDIKVTKLLASKLCHDLVGPAGAVHNGLELVQEMGDDGGEALTMVSSSVGQLSARLSFFRMAFGMGGLTGRLPALTETREMAAAFLQGGRVVLDWPADVGADFAQEMTAENYKLLLNMILVATDALPRGGAIAVSLVKMPENQGIGMALRATGEGAQIKAEMHQMLDSPAPEGLENALNAHNVHGYFCQRLAEELGSAIEVSEGGGEVKFAVLV